MEAIHGAGALALQWRLRQTPQGRVLRLGQRWRGPEGRVGVGDGDRAR